MNLLQSDHDAIVEQGITKAFPHKQNRVAPTFEFVADSAIYKRDIPFQMASLYVWNCSNVEWTVSFDSGAIATVFVGACFLTIPPSSAHLTAQSVSNGNGTLILIPFDEAPDLSLGGVNILPAPYVPNEHIGNGTATNATTLLAPKRTTRVSLSIVNEGTVPIRAGNTADLISPTVGLYVPANGGSVTFIGGEQIDVCSTGGNSAFSWVDAYN